MTSDSKRILELGEIMKTITPPKKIQTSEFLESGDYPIVDQSPPNIAGWTNDETALVHPPKDGLIVFGDHTCVLKFETNSFAQGADGIKIIEVIKDINPHYVYAHLKAFPLLNDGYKRHFSELKRLKILIPERGIQNYISDVQRSFDSKVESNETLSKTLEDFAQALFKSWFIDFDPVKAKIAGEKPEGMGAATAALFPDSMADSELGLIPKGWNIACIGDISSIHGGKMLSREEFIDDGTFPIFGGAGVMGNSNRSNAEGFVITIGRVGAYCGQFFYHRGSAWVNNNASRIIPQESISGEWMYLFLKSFDIESIKKGAAQPFVSNSDLANSKLLLPIPEIIQRFTEVVGPIFEQSETLKNQTRLLLKLRDSLLPRLISGELQIPEEMLAS
jgi:restriction endonuclease S subunit